MGDWTESSKQPSAKFLVGRLAISNRFVNLTGVLFNIFTGQIKIIFSINANYTSYTILMLFQTTSTETSTQYKPFLHRFKPFEPKKGMSVAPVIRKCLSLETKRLLDEGLQHQVRSSYLNS